MWTSTTDEGRTAFRRLAERADLIIETEPPGRLAGLGIDHADLVAANPRLVQVSLTPFGRTGPRATWKTTDLVTAALGGVLSLSGLPDEPVNPWGRQSFNVGGFIAAICGLAGVRAARLTGVGQHVDVAMHEAVCTTIEQLFFQYWFDDVQPYPKVAPRQGSLHWIGAYVVVPAKSGWMMITPAPNVPGLLQWMIDEGFEEVEALTTMPLEELVADVPRLMKTIASFAATKDATELFHAAQERHVAFGEVLSVAQVADNPQHEFRRFFRARRLGRSECPRPGAGRALSWHAGSRGRAAAGLLDRRRGVLVRLGRARSPRVKRKSSANDRTNELKKPLEGLRVVDLSHVLAGPFCTRLLGDLGADIIKFQTTERATIVNDPNHPYFYVWNRSKRAVSLNMKDERAADVARRVIEQADVVIENFSAGVLARWGLSYETVAAWNPSVVYLTMSGCGHEGPWSQLVTYAPTIHALSGLTYLSNPPGRGDVGPGFSLNDHAAGLSAAFAILAALEARERTGSRSACRHLTDGDRRVHHRPRSARLPDQRPRSATRRQRRPVRPARPQQLLPDLGRSVAGGQLPRRRGVDQARCRDRGRGDFRSERGRCHRRPLGSNSLRGRRSGVAARCRRPGRRRPRCRRPHGRPAAARTRTVAHLRPRGVRRTPL